MGRIKFCLSLLYLMAMFQMKTAFGQDFMMQAWYWDYPKTAQGHNWADTLQQKLADLQAAGITQMWLPPLSRASFGNGSNGYDPKDLYDLGEYGGGATGFGTRAQLDQIIADMADLGMVPVADVVYNHRDGGRPEINGAVEGWIENYTCAKASAGDNCYPSDRFRCFLPLGGSSGNGAGNYYFKIRSASKHPNFYGKGYTFYVHTNTVGFQGLSPQMEIEPNGGGDCGQGFNTVQLGRDMVAAIDNTFGCGGSCGIDEFELVIQPSDFNASGDTLWIYLTNPNGNYSDHFVWGLYSTSVNADIQNQIKYQTYTDFTNLPSGQGAMNFSNFKPNGNPTNLGGDWDTMLFFYDYDQSNNDTAEKLIQWSKWLWQHVGIRGLRMDAVKHFNPAFVGRLLDSLHAAGINPPMVVGEFYDDSTPLLKNWNDQVRANMSASALAAIDVRVFDFGLRRALKDASDLFGYDVRNVFNAGLVDGAGASPFSSVTFVNNHDFRDEGQPIYNDPLLGYAYIMTNNKVGLPCIFYPDYYGVTLPHGPDDYLKPDLDQLMAIHKSFIVGASSHRYINRFGTSDAITYHSGFPNTTLLYQLSGGGGEATEVVVAINYAGEALDVSFPVQNLSNGTVLFDKTGKALTPEVVVSGGRIRTVIPARSYAIFQRDSSFVCNRASRIYVNASATGLNNGSSWKDAFRNLQSALTLANQCTDIQEIWVAEGTYTPDYWARRDQKFEIRRGLRVIGGFPNTGSPTLTDRDTDAHPTILSGQYGVASLPNQRAYRVLQTASMQDTCELLGLYISSGYADGPAHLGQDRAAGIRNLGLLKMTECRLTQHFAIAEASAFINEGDEAVAHLEDVITNQSLGTTPDVLNKDAAKISVDSSFEIRKD